MFDKNEFGKQVKYYRNKRNLTIEALSELAEIGNPYLFNIERGRHTPTLRTIVSILSALNLNYSSLMDPSEYEKNVDSTILSEICTLSEKEIDFMIKLLNEL